MRIQQVLDFVNEIIYTKTGSRLNDLQSAIIEGILKKMTYSDIAENFERSEGHVKDVGYKLLQMLSDTLDEPVDKNNLKSVLERRGDLNFSFGDNTVLNTCNLGCSIINQQKPSTKKVTKLRKFGLSDEQIAEVLEMDVDDVKNLR